MTKKQLAATVSAICALLISAAAALSSHGRAGEAVQVADKFGERVRAIEVRHEEIKDRLDRIEDKQDKMIEFLKRSNR